MRIGVISDTHISAKDGGLPLEVLDGFKHVDMVIHAGDMVDPAVFRKLQSACKDVRAVRGNMDVADLENNFPEKLIIHIGKHSIGVMHGHGTPANLVEVLKEAFKNDLVDVIIFGHSHSPFNEKINGILFFNPGSPTDKVFAPYNSYGIIEVNDNIEARIIKI